MNRILKLIKFISFAVICYSIFTIPYPLTPIPCLYAADVQVAVSVPRTTIGLDEQLEMNVNVSGPTMGISDPKFVALPNFTIYSSGRSQNVSIINGKVSSSISYSYRLVPKTTGKFTIPPVMVEHEGNIFQSQSIDVEVTPAGKSPGQSGAPGQNSVRESMPGQQNKGLFITASLDKKSAYINEQVTYTFRFYRRVQLLSNPQYTPPDFSGLWTEEIPPRNFYATVNGQQYLVTEVKTILFPAKAGTFALGNASLQCNIQDFDQSDPHSDDFFSSFFSRGRTQVLKTQALSLAVLALPETGKPAQFSGAVGRYKMSAELDKKTVKANEPLTLTIILSGTGNMKTLPQPSLPEWPDFKKYETVSSFNVNNDGGVVKGSKVFKTVIIPQTQGRKTIQPVAFTFFDPAQKSYVTEHTSPLALEVKPGDPGAAAPLSSAPSENNVKVINQDIRYIKTLSSWKNGKTQLYRNTWFILANTVPVFLFGFAFVFQRWQQRLSSDVAFARKLKASGVAKKYLKHAKSILTLDRSSDYYCALSRSLLEYIAHKTNVSADGLTSASIAAMLSDRHVSKENIALVKELLDECDLVRFAPTQVTVDMMKTAFSRVEELINKLDKEL